MPNLAVRSHRLSSHCQAASLLALLALALLAGCSGDSVDFKTPSRPQGLAIQDTGLDPAAQETLPENPSQLESTTAWILARDAQKVSVLTAIVPEEDIDDDFDVSALTYDPILLEAIGEEDELGWIRYEAEIPSRSVNDALVYYFEVEDDTGVALRQPEGGSLDAITVLPIPFEIDFAWPDWPELYEPIACIPDLGRIYDGGANEGTLVPAPAFEPIATPIWKRPSEATVMGNLSGLQTGVGVEVSGEYYFFPLVVMLWNEVSNQTIGGVRTGTSYCPLTDTALAFDTGWDPDELPRNRTFAPAGLFNSNLSVGRKGLRPGEATAFNQMMGFGFTGPQSGVCLKPMPSVITGLSFWGKLHPDTWVLNGDPALLDSFDYTSRENPYDLYWRNNEIRFPVGSEDPLDRLHPKDHVMGIMGAGDPLAIPLLGGQFVHHDTVQDTPIVVFYQAKTAFCLESRLPDTGQELRFSRANASWNGIPLYKDDQAEPSLWTPEGVAIRGPLRGQRLAWVPSMSAFWFAWYAMYPETRFVESPGL